MQLTVLFWRGLGGGYSTQEYNTQKKKLKNAKIANFDFAFKLSSKSEIGLNAMMHAQIQQSNIAILAFSYSPVIFVIVFVWIRPRSSYLTWGRAHPCAEPCLRSVPPYRSPCRRRKRTGFGGTRRTCTSGARTHSPPKP